MDTDKDMMSVEDAARRLGISRRSAYEGCNSGEIPCIRVGRRILVPIARYQAWLAGESDVKQPGA